MGNRVTGTTGDLASLVAPRSIALVGASGDRTKVGAMPLHFLQKYQYQGRIYPVNPGYTEINGLRCYASVTEIPDEIDLMVVTVGASQVQPLIESLPPGKVKSALVLTSGYAEVGEEGRRRQQELVRAARSRGIRLCGPNSVGVVNLFEAVVPCISQAFDAVFSPGPVAFVTQSGALGTAVIALARQAGIHLGYFISTGNEADLDFTDFCEYFIDDPNVRVIAGYLEGVRDGRKFAACARRALAAGKPVVLLKVGRSEVGKAAAQSHTGSLAGSAELYQHVFDRCGVVQVHSIEAMLDVLKILSAWNGAAIGPRIAVLTHSGGTGVLLSDVCTDHGLTLPPASAALKAELQKSLPPYAALTNPVDMTANVIFKADVMVGCLETALRSGEYDTGILSVNLMWRIADQLADHLIGLRERQERPFAVNWIGVPEAQAIRLQAAGVPVYSDPARCVQAVAAAIRWAGAREAALAATSPGLAATTPPLDPAAPAPLPASYRERAALLERYGLPLAPAHLVTSMAEATEKAARLGYPVVAKLVSDAASHKSDVGGVILGIRSEAELAAAWERLSRLTEQYPAEGILIQSQVQGGMEIFAGGKRDPVFGPVVVFGMGGIYVEILRETAVALAPLTAAEAEALIRRSRAYDLLCGARGQARRDLPALADVLVRLSRLMAEQPVASMDLNPVMVMPEGQGAIVADFRIFFGGDGGAAD